MDSHARHGAAATRNHTAPGPTPAGYVTDGATRAGQAATAISQAASIGRHHSAAARTRRGGQPAHHA
jgi:hypothetical protein